MNLLRFGLNLKGKQLFPPIKEATLEQDLIDALERNGDRLKPTTRTTSTGTAFKSSEIRRKIVDFGDPVVAGWSFLIDKKDPQLGDIEEILKPLASRRGMSDPKAPLVFNREPPEGWFDWLHDNYYALELNGKKPPHYILIVGGPERIPFHFQSILAVIAGTGFDEGCPPPDPPELPPDPDPLAHPAINIDNVRPVTARRFETNIAGRTSTSRRQTWKRTCSH